VVIAISNIAPSGERPAAIRSSHRYSIPGANSNASLPTTSCRGRDRGPDAESHRRRVQRDDLPAEVEHDRGQSHRFEIGQGGRK